MRGKRGSFVQEVQEAFKVNREGNNSEGEWQAGSVRGTREVIKRKGCTNNQCRV